MAAGTVASMTRVVSVLTAAWQPVPEYLAAAHESIRSQVMPAGWDWQWIVQEDGDSGEVAAMLPADPRISPGRGRRAGEPVTRNLCLSRATGELVKVLDADDQLTPGTLAREIAVLSAQPGIGWTTASALDLLPDGSTRGSDADPAEGRIERGAVLRYWRANGYRAGVHPATLCIRRDLVLALGGWMALPASGDTGLLMAASAVTTGYFIATPGLLYRKWPGQATSQAPHTDQVEWPARMAIIEARAKSLAALCGPPWSLRSGPQPLGVEDAKADRDAEAGDQPEPDHDGGLGPADHLEMIVQRAHLEHPHPAPGPGLGDLEDADLDDHRQRHDREQAAQDA
jgi:glycosyltransferase involved in cell wall biosynthesis